MSDAPVTSPQPSEETAAAAPEAVTPAENAPAAPAADVSATPAAPAAEVPAAKPATPAKPAEPAFNADQLQSSTSRFTHKAWRLYYDNRKDLTFLQEAPMRASLNARSIEGGEELEALLRSAGVTEISRKGNTIAFTATFAIIQTIIRHPQTLLIDIIRL